MTEQLPDVEPDLDTSATNNPIAMEAPALFDLGAVVATQSTELKPPVCKPVKDGACIECCAEADFAPSHVESASAPSWLPSHG